MQIIALITYYKKLKAVKSDDRGMLLVELLIVISIMGFFAMVMMTMQSNQLKSNNYLEFQLKRNQLQGTLIGQFLNDPENCACLFRGSDPFPINPPGQGHTLTGTDPSQVGRFRFVTPGNCSTATVPDPFITRSGRDGLNLESVSLTNIRNISGSYSGKLSLNIQSTKNVAGPKELSLQIPVNVQVSPVSGSSVNFVSCTTQGSGNSTVNWLPSTPMIMCSSAEVCGSVVGVRSDNWTNLDLKPLGVSGNVKTLILRVYGHEATIYVKKANRNSPPNYTNHVMISWNNYSGFTEVRIDMEGSNGVVSYAIDLTNPPTYTSMIQVVGYEE